MNTVRQTLYTGRARGCLRAYARVRTAGGRGTTSGRWRRWKRAEKLDSDCAGRSGSCGCWVDLGWVSQYFLLRDCPGGLDGYRREARDVPHEHDARRVEGGVHERPRAGEGAGGGSGAGNAVAAGAGAVRAGVGQVGGPVRGGEQAGGVLYAVAHPPLAGGG